MLSASNSRAWRAIRRIEEPMKVLHVISAPAGDGAGSQIRLLIRRLPHHGEVVTLSPAGPVVDALRDDGIVVHEQDAGGDRDPAVARRLRELLRPDRFDLVHTHLPRARTPGRLAARWAG